MCLSWSCNNYQHQHDALTKTVNAILQYHKRNSQQIWGSVHATMQVSTVSPSVYWVWFNSVFKQKEFYLEYVAFGKGHKKMILSHTWPHLVSHIPFPGFEFFSLCPSKCSLCSFLCEELSVLRKLGLEVVGSLYCLFFWLLLFFLKVEYYQC